MGFNLDLLSNISSIRCSVSSPDETSRREPGEESRHWKYDTQRNFWRTSRCFTRDETLHLMLDIVFKQNDFSRRNEGCKNEQFSSDFQTLIKH